MIPQREGILVGASSNDKRICGMFQFSFYKFLRFVGPGFLMSIAYIDPGNLQADIQLGGAAGYRLLWLLLLSTTIGGVFQTRAINVAVVTGKHLAEHCRETFPASVHFVLWLMVEIAIIAADIQEVLGSATALNILTREWLPIWSGTLITVVDTCVFLMLQQSGVRKLEAFFCALIMLMSAMFGYLYFSNFPPQLEVFKGIVIPQVPAGSLTQAVGLVGAIIMPHNLYLHSALMLTRSVDRSDPLEVRDSLAYNHIESALALLVSFFINMFVVCNFANIKKFPANISSRNMGVASAAKCLEINFGTPFKYIWAIGLLASGQSSTCTGTLTGQYVMQGFLKLELSPWKRLTLVRLLAVFPALFVAIYTDSPQKIDEISEWLNILQAVLLPFAVLPLVCFSASKARLRGYADAKLVRIFLYISIIAIIGANFCSVYEFLAPYSFLVKPWLLAGSAFVGVFYVLFLLYFVCFLWKGEIPTVC